MARRRVKGGLGALKYAGGGAVTAKSLASAISAPEDAPDYRGLDADQTAKLANLPQATYDHFSDALGGLGQAIAAPHDAMSGQFDPSSDEGIGRALGTAGLAMTGGLGATAPEGALTAGLARRAAPVSDEDLMLTMHNTSQRKLEMMDQLGGLPVPSLAITKPSLGFNGYGDVTLVGPQGLATPSRTNPVFASDVYSPRFPQLNDDKTKIFKGYTPSGNQRYAPLTMDNVVKEMKGDIRGGEGFNYGAGSLRSAVTPQFRNMKEIQASRDNLISHEAFDPLKDQTNDQLFALADKFRPLSKYPDSNPFIESDRFIDRLQDYAKGNSRWLRDAYPDAPPELMDEAHQYLGRLRDMPTEYFEAKPQRAVRFDELAGAIIPPDQSRVADILRQRGISRIEEYDPANPQTRSDAMMKFKDHGFARGGKVTDELDVPAPAQRLHEPDQDLLDYVLNQQAVRAQGAIPPLDWAGDLSGARGQYRAPYAEGGEVTNPSGSQPDDPAEADHNQNLAAIVAHLAGEGRGHDSVLAHINPREAALLKALGGSGKTNPYTGILEFDDGDGGDGGGDDDDDDDDDTGDFASDPASDPAASDPAASDPTASDPGANNSGFGDLSGVGDGFGGLGGFSASFGGDQAASAAASNDQSASALGDTAAGAFGLSGVSGVGAATDAGLGDLSFSTNGFSAGPSADNSAAAGQNANSANNDNESNVDFSAFGALGNAAATGGAELGSVSNGFGSLGASSVGDALGSTASGAFGVSGPAGNDFSQEQTADNGQLGLNGPEASTAAQTAADPNFDLAFNPDPMGPAQSFNPSQAATSQDLTSLASQMLSNDQQAQVAAAMPGYAASPNDQQISATLGLSPTTAADLTIAGVPADVIADVMAGKQSVQSALEFVNSPELMISPNATGPTTSSAFTPGPNTPNAPASVDLMSMSPAEQAAIFGSPSASTSAPDATAAAAAAAAAEQSAAAASAPSAAPADAGLGAIAGAPAAAAPSAGQPGAPTDTGAAGQIGPPADVAAPDALSQQGQSGSSGAGAGSGAGASGAAPGAVAAAQQAAASPALNFQGAASSPAAIAAILDAAGAGQQAAPAAPAAMPSTAARASPLTGLANSSPAPVPPGMIGQAKGVAKSLDPMASPSSLHAIPNITERGIHTMALAMVGEAAKEGQVGMAAVGHVIANRALTNFDGNTSPEAVVTQKGQFSFLHDKAGVMAREAQRSNSPAYQQALAIARDIAAGKSVDPTLGAVNYRNAATATDKSGYHANSERAGSVQIGNHTFSGFANPSASAKGDQRSDAAEPGVMDTIMNALSALNPISSAQAAPRRATAVGPSSAWAATMPDFRDEMAAAERAEAAKNATWAGAPATTAQTLGALPASVIATQGVPGAPMWTQPTAAMSPYVGPASASPLLSAAAMPDTSSPAAPAAAPSASPAPAPATAVAAAPAPAPTPAPIKTISPKIVGPILNAAINMGLGPLGALANLASLGITGQSIGAYLAAHPATVEQMVALAAQHGDQQGGDGSGANPRQSQPAQPASVPTSSGIQIPLPTSPASFFGDRTYTAPTDVKHYGFNPSQTMFAAKGGLATLKAKNGR